MDNYANLELLGYVGRRLYGERWQTAIAADLGVNARVVRGWLSSTHSCPTDIGDRLIKALDCRRSVLADAQEEVRYREFKLRFPAT